MSKIKIEIELDLSNSDDLVILNTVNQALTGAKAPAAANIKEEEAPKAPSKPSKPVKKVANEKPEEANEKPEEANEDAVISAETFTIEEVRATLATAKRSGKPNDAIKAILQEHGTSLVSGLDPKDYAAVVAKVKAL